MKLRNKKTGEIIELELGNYKNPTEEIILVVNHEPKYRYTSLAELNEEWQDYEEPKEVWYIDFQGVVRSASREENDWFKENEIGNYFETKEEAKKAVEKLKAWKRLKDKGFKFSYYHEIFDNKIHIEAKICTHWSLWKENTQIREDLELLFGGEE